MRDTRAHSDLRGVHIVISAIVGIHVLAVVGEPSGGPESGLLGIATALNQVLFAMVEWMAPLVLPIVALGLVVLGALFVNAMVEYEVRQRVRLEVPE